MKLLMCPICGSGKITFWKTLNSSRWNPVVCSECGSKLTMNIWIGGLFGGIGGFVILQLGKWAFTEQSLLSVLILIVSIFLTLVALTVFTPLVKEK